MAGRLELEDDRSRVALAPHRGGGVLEAVALARGGPVPILRPPPGGGPFGIGCNLLVPFSNRVSGGGFEHGGRFHPIAPNVPGEAFPLHGDGFGAVWTVRDHDRRAARLTHRGAIGPFRYRAEVRYRLEGGALHAALAMTNTGAPLPFGGGFHPWFPRGPATRVAFHATGVWTETAEHLPDAHLPLDRHRGRAFDDLRPPPDGWINEGYTGWDGRATIAQGDVTLTLTAAPPLGTLLVHSPGRDAGFVCLEPVSHPVDALNLPGRPGLVTLGPGETLVLSMTLDWRDAPAQAGDGP